MKRILISLILTAAMVSTAWAEVKPIFGINGDLDMWGTMGEGKSMQNNMDVTATVGVEFSEKVSIETYFTTADSQFGYEIHSRRTVTHLAYARHQLDTRLAREVLSHCEMYPCMGAHLVLRSIFNDERSICCRASIMLDI